MNRELQSCTPKCDESRNGKARMTAAFPTIETEIADATEADVAEDLGAAAATDDDKCDARMTREVLQHTAGRGRKVHLIGSPRDVNERAVKIEKHGYTAAQLDLSGYAIPMRDKARSHALQPAHRASTRSGV